jgi:hypothetical protein
LCIDIFELKYHLFTGYVQTCLSNIEERRKGGRSRDEMKMARIENVLWEMTNNKYINMQKAFTYRNSDHYGYAHNPIWLLLSVR